MGIYFSKCWGRGENDKTDEQDLSQKQNRNQGLINNQMDNKGGLAVYSQIIDVNDNSVIRYEKNKENQNENNLKKISLKNDNLLETKSKELNKREKMAINADQLLEKLKLEIPEDAYCLLGIIDNDLYTETLLPNGKRLIKATYGKKSVADRVSIFSLARFDPFFNFNGKIKNLSKEQRYKISLILLKRVCSAITREICYMFGMKNCTFMSCCMNGTNVAEFDNKQIELCPICLRKLITNIRANGEDIKTYRVKKPLIVYNRFVKMRDALDNFSGLYENELKWFNARIDFLKTLI